MDWYVDVTMPANSAALKNVWLLDYLPQANVTEYETLPYLVGLTSNSLDGEFLMAHEKEFGKYFTPDKNSELFQYLHGLVEGNGNGVFTITGNGLDENSAAAAAGNAYALLCAPAVQSGSVRGYSDCSPFLVSIPTGEADGWVYDIDATPKTDIVRLIDITVKKIWSDARERLGFDAVHLYLWR